MKSEMYRPIWISLIPLLLAGCTPPAKPQKTATRLYSHSADFSDQYVYLSATVALHKYTKTDDSNVNPGPHYSLVRAHYAGRPDYVWASGDVIDTELVSGVQRLVLMADGRVLLMDTGSDLPSDPRYWTVGLRAAERHSGSTTDAVLSGTGLPTNATPTWIAVDLFFDIKREEVRLATETK